MVKYVRLVVVGFLLFFVENSSAQFVQMNDAMRMANKKSKNIVSGKVEFEIQDKLKKSTDFTSQNATLIFHNNVKDKVLQMKKAGCFNLLFHGDSVQYISNSESFVTINHKNKTIQIDSMEYPGIEISPKFTTFVSFYLNLMGVTWLYDVAIDKTINTDTSTIFTLKTKRVKPLLLPKYQQKADKKRAKNLSKNNKDAIFDDIYEIYLDTYHCRKSDSLLTEYSFKLLNTKPYVENILVKKKIRLSTSQINDTIYQSNDFYNYQLYVNDDYTFVLEDTLPENKKNKSDSTQKQKSVKAIKDQLSPITQKSKSLLCGKVEFISQQKHKDSADFTTSLATMIFHNNASAPSKQGQLNLFFHKDSTQYIGDDKTLIFIDHKQKSIHVDTTKYARGLTLLLFSDFIYFYNNTLNYMSSYDVAVNSNSKDSTYTCVVKAEKFRPKLSAKYQKKEEKRDEKRARKSDGFFDIASFINKMNTSYIDTYKCRKIDSLLVYYSSKVVNPKPYTGNSVVEKRAYLLDASINDTLYKSPHFYNYRSYTTDDYKINIALTTEESKAQLDSMKNTPAPQFALPVIGTKDTLKLSDYKGKWILLDFWFMDCKPCMILMPEIENVYKQYTSKGLEVFGVSIDENNSRLQDFVKNKKTPYPMLCSHGTEVADLYKVNFFPTIILINPEQEIVFVGSGSNISEDLEIFLNENVK